MSSNRMTYVALNVSDLERSIRFYRDIVGIPLHEASHDKELDDPWYGVDSGFPIVQEAREEQQWI